MQGVQSVEEDWQIWWGSELPDYLGPLFLPSPFPLRPLPIFSPPQGVEFFDEKLNSLCMAWLVDHGKYPQQYSRTGS